MSFGTIARTTTLQKRVPVRGRSPYSALRQRYMCGGVWPRDLWLACEAGAALGVRLGHHF